ncbi:MAG: CSLREA domain-containing protein, partial [Calditrichaeota bacterium]|nr:CSLREA domain-containing protein [Calditrichota bacterium]
MKKEMFWVLVAALLAVLMVSPSASQINFDVNSTGDGADSNPGDGVCNDGTGTCTLRAAIEEANALPGKNRIGFNIPGALGTVHIIQPTTALPRILDPVIINGYTQPGASPGALPILLIVVDGGALPSAAGLQIDGGNSVVKGLAINNFANGTAVIINSDRNVVQGNYIGMDVTSTISQPNSVGISIFAANNRIGGNTLNARNILSGND